MDAYAELVSDLREQAEWWKSNAAECETKEGRAMLLGCSAKILYLIERRDDDGELKPVITGK